MRASKMLISTLKEAPSEAKIDSHKLLLRAGYIKNEVAGIYNYLPLGLRVLNKIENIIREEMDKKGCNEILCSAIQPKELWCESGRWYKYGPELMRLKDRHDREFCLGPTHEEVFTSIARDLIKSPKQLPINLYQIQTKYRDEFRPRFGLMRSREFIMKDAYSFDKDEEGLDKSYQEMYDAYTKVFTRCDLKFKPVLADTGAIGGNGSHQFMALCPVGESDIVYCESCNYAADVEKSEAVCTLVDQRSEQEMKMVDVGNAKTIEEMVDFYKVPSNEMVKSVLYKDTETKKLYLVLVRGDREVNEIKVVNAIGTAEAFLTFASDEDIKNLNTYEGFIGPIGLSSDVEILVDKEVSLMKNAIYGANELHKNYINVNYGRDYNGKVLDLRKAVEGDLCPCCNKPMKIERGIEVGQIFKLQTKYSSAMNCTYQNESGKNVPMVMGCYGIGVTRTMTAIIEQHHDEFGIKWPLNVAPYHAVVLPLVMKDSQQVELAEKIYNSLSTSGVETIIDDRDAKPGFKFKDWDLMGIPYQVVCGKRAGEGIVELKNRNTNEKVEVPYEEAIKVIVDAVKLI